MARIVAFGEIMARLSPPGHQRFQQAMPGAIDVTFAGAEASIAASIAYMGGDAAFVTALPQQAVADACIANLKSMGIDTQHILRTDEGRLGIYFFEMGANQRASQVIYDRDGASVAITSADRYDWTNILKEAEWFIVSGITPAISRNAAEVTRSAIAHANRLGVKVAIDMNYRSKLWQWSPPLKPRELATQTMRALMPMVDLFIGGREDAVEMLGIPDIGSDPDSLHAIAQQIVRQFPRMSLVAMTRREGLSANHNNFGGMFYQAATDEVSFAPQVDGKPGMYEIHHIVDRLGAGDAFTAGLIHALTTSGLRNPATAVAFATAAGCLAHSIEGDFNYVSASEIEALMRGDSSGRVKR